MHWKNRLQSKPLRVLTALGGLRDIVIGLVFIIGHTQVQSLTLYQNFDSLIPGLSGILAGIAFLSVGVFAFATAGLDMPVLAKYPLKFQALMWMFSSIVYIMSGNWLLALIYGLVNSIPAAYIAYNYTYALRWVQKEAELKREIEELRTLLRGGP